MLKVLTFLFVVVYVINWGVFLADMLGKWAFAAINWTAGFALLTLKIIRESRVIKEVIRMEEKIKEDIEEKYGVRINAEKIRLMYQLLNRSLEGR